MSIIFGDFDVTKFPFFLLKKHFVIPDGVLFNNAILKRTGKYWKNYRYFLREKYFDPERTKVENDANRPDGISKQNWIDLVDYWLSPEFQVCIPIGYKGSTTLAGMFIDILFLCCRNYRSLGKMLEHHRHIVTLVVLKALQIDELFLYNFFFTFKNLSPQKIFRLIVISTLIFRKKRKEPSVNLNSINQFIQRKTEVLRRAHCLANFWY